MKLYAGYEDDTYEYAVWAPSKRIVAQIMHLPLAIVNSRFWPQGEALKYHCYDKSKVYRRDLGDDENPWQAFKEAA